MNLTDSQTYVVVCCAIAYQDFDRNFVTKIELIEGKHSVYILLMSDLVGTLAVVPNVCTIFPEG